MKNLKIMLSCVLVCTLIYLSSCGGDDFEPENANITGCSTFTYEDMIFTLPSGRCEEGAIVDYDVTENGETFKFKIVCDGICIESVETRE